MTFPIVPNWTFRFLLPKPPLESLTAPTMEHSLLLKLVMIGVFFVASFAAASAPWLIARKVQRTAVLFSILNCFAGGIIVGAAFSHMIPGIVLNFVNREILKRDLKNTLEKMMVMMPTSTIVMITKEAMEIILLLLSSARFHCWDSWQWSI